MSPAASRDTLFLAATRPAMRWGVPMEGYYLNLFGTWLLGMVLGSPLWWATFFVWHLPMVALTNRNPHFFHELRMWYVTRGQTIGGVLRALPDRAPRRAKDLVSGV
ncbi:VirB3 family type IV secretion system protein [Roseicella frigidaeris]|uniref:Type IV secretion system protein VirB3 n=3 Tax=Roseicella TaxID=2730923 RepID=A0A327LYQ6_9PROT|nr:VirB3 family type IV secretion system protein [Roseicella frigidaeris]RAI56051.1 type IV secretion system protein VirB3 [Roseicella frigidaeris]